MAKKTKPREDVLVSVTFSIERKWRDKLLQYAKAIGAIRKQNNGKEMIGDLSKAIKALLVCGLTNIDFVEKWRSAEVTKVMSGEIKTKAD